MNSLQTRVDDLWSDLETHYAPTLTPDDLATLRSLDDGVTDGTLTQRHLDDTQRYLMANRRRTWKTHDGDAERALKAYRETRRSALYGDYELLIDACLEGDPEVKERVREADLSDRRGLATLKYHLSRRKAQIPRHLATVMSSCEADQDLYDAKRSDMRKIDQHRGKLRVRMTVDGKRQTALFDTLEEAREFRDRNELVLGV